MIRILLIALVIINFVSCGQKSSNRTIGTSSINNSTEQKLSSRYFTNSLAFSVIDTTTDSSLFVSFMSNVKTLRTPVKFDSLYNYKGEGFSITQRVNEYDSLMFLKSDSGKILSNRILSEIKD